MLKTRYNELSYNEQGYSKLNHNKLRYVELNYRVLKNIMDLVITNNWLYKQLVVTNKLCITCYKDFCLKEPFKVHPVDQELIRSGPD